MRLILTYKLARSGAIYCFTNDLLRFGIGILSNKLLSRQRTFHWLKPRSRTSSLTLSLGQPCEIIRSDSLTINQRVVDFYTKNGAIGKYASLLVLVPDFDIAISILSVGDSGSLTLTADTVIRQTMPNLEDIAKGESEMNCGGHYENGNSSLTITHATGPGLKVDKWVNDGRDIL